MKLNFKNKIVLFIDVKSTDIRHDDIIGDKHRSSRVSLNQKLKIKLKIGMYSI